MVLLGIVCTVSHHRIDDAGQLCAAGYLGGLLAEAVIFLFGDEFSDLRIRIMSEYVGYAEVQRASQESVPLLGYVQVLAGVLS